MELVVRWPVFAAEVAGALQAEGHGALAAQVQELTVVEACNCGGGSCQSFYTAVKPEGAYGPGHSNVVLDPPWPGMLILDVVDGRIMFVEVLDRPPLD